MTQLRQHILKYQMALMTGILLYYAHNSYIPSNKVMFKLFL